MSVPIKSKSMCNVYPYHITRLISMMAYKYAGGAGLSFYLLYLLYFFFTGHLSIHSPFVTFHEQ